MSYKNTEQMTLVKKAKVTYLVEMILPAVKTVWNKLKSMFNSLVDAIREHFKKVEPEYIKLPPRQPVPLAVKPTHAEPSRTVFLPIQRFRGRR